MWAQFKDPSGNINDYQNYIQGTAGTEPSWSGWQHPDIWKAEGWRNDLPDTWIPPQPPKTTEELLSELDAEYQPKFNALSLAWATASMDGNTELAASIKADKDNLIDEYNARREAFASGD